MRVVTVVLVVLLGAVNATAQQPSPIVLSSTGYSRIYPVFDSEGWVQTFGSPYHVGKDQHAQDWANSCGATAGKKVFAAISGKVVFAGWADGYGNSVVVWDQRSAFALRYAHFSAIDVSVDEFVLAGISEIGRVGNTGIHVATACRTNPGAHLHLSLYKNVTNWPLTLGATNAASFGYAAPVTLIKGNTSAAVYVYDGYSKRPVTAFSYRTNGWGFTGSINFVANYSQAWIDSLPTGATWPPRSNTLFKGTYDPTVYLIEDGARRAVPGDIFSCRGWSFDQNVLNTVNEGEQHTYRPTSNPPVLNSCFNDTEQAIKDMVQRANADWRFDSLPFLHQYSAPNMLNDPNWEWRQMLFRLRDGRHIWMAHIIYRYNPEERYTEFWDPDTQQNTGWIRAW